ncbi:MAG: GFA family protein [Deltaproteobacteria bacterium]|nr:GFA family protein [Deltaproteobacteria bacterium]
MAEPTLHHGGCHCGAVRYHVELDLESKAIACNCSICGRSGSLLQFVPEAKFTLEKGDDQLTDYQFNRRHIHHVFCKTCGIKSFARGTSPTGDKMVAVNVRCLDDVDVFTQPTQQYDGKKL